MQFNDVLSIMAIVTIFVSILWIFIQRDVTTDPRVGRPLLVDFKSMAPINKIGILTNKLVSQRSRLSQTIVKLSHFDECFGKLKKLQSKVHLQYSDEIMQCSQVIMWLKESNTYRDR